ncbi:hypothetical protein BC629DRAFT_435434 [Irpex lacteus]|nr:hypothetical protein BC629DRAFT_435434 [Irpex lacteus]
MNTPLKVRKLLRTISLASLRATVGFNAHTTPHNLHNYHSGYTPFHSNYTTPDTTFKGLRNDNGSDTSSEDSIAQEDRRFRKSYYVVLDALRHIRYLWVKTPLELSREVRAQYDELDTPILVTSSHNPGYVPRTVYQPPDPGYIRVSMCCLKAGRIQELGLYDDIPVYCGGRLPHGRVHFSMTRDLWQLPNVATLRLT